MIVSGTFLGVFAAASAPTLPSADIAAVGPSGALKGTIEGKLGHGQPVVLIIPGSGPTDRDGNSRLGIKAATYRLLAEGLAQHGIVTVRIDKRGMFASAGAVPDANAVTLDDYVRDTNSWIEAIRQRTGASCVWLMGHSEGGLVALATAAERADHICGLVLLATAGRPLGEVLKQQLRANPANAPILDTADRAIDTLSAGHSVDVATLPPPLAQLFRHQVQGFLISEIAVDPAKLVCEVRKPVLILQGERDIQVATSDAQRLKDADPSAQLKLLPDANHVFKQVKAGNRGANIATYADPNLPLAPGVVETIAGFIKAGK